MFSSYFLFLKTIRLSATLGTETYPSMWNARNAVPITDAESKLCKVQQQVQLRMQGFNLAKLKQTRASNKQQTSE
jgi:hypothetical protein